MNRKGLVIIFFSLIISILNLFPVLGQNPFIPKYDAVKRSERCFTVTWELNNQFGAVWWADQVDFSRDTLFNFVVYMGDRDGNGADGLAFVMHQDPRDTVTDASQTVVIGGAGTWDLEAATGDDGGGLGFAMHQSRVGPNTIPGPHGPGDDPENHKIQKSVAVEMDTWNNNDVPDGNNGTDANGVNQAVSPFFGWDHTAVIYNGDIYGGQQLITDANGISDRILPLKPSYAFGNGNNPDGSPHHNIEDDRCYLFQIKWEVNPDGTQNIQLWADVYNGTTNTDGLQMVMTHTDDMINNVFGGNPIMRFGFTGSTGGAINEQTICLLGENLKPFAQDDYASIPMNATAVIDVESNDNDPDGDQLHVPIIIEPARFGTATIFDSLDINYMRYTPNTNYIGLDTIGYVTCDVNSTKCYAKCDTAFVYIDVGCVPFDITVNPLSPSTLCNDTLPQNGAAEASVTVGNQFGILWSEDFGGLADGTTSTSKWMMDESNANYDQGRDHAEVRNNRISISDIGGHGAGNYVTWSSEVIDISSVSDISITVDLEGSGNMESGANRDYINVYYKIDGGPEIPLSNGTHTGGNFNAIASVSGLNGTTIQIVVRATNSANNEYYYFDNVIVQAVGAGTANMSYNWYRGIDTSGAPDFIGQIYNNMNSGLYTVIGMDLNTGCLSNPQTVTIDSATTKPVGGYIIQAAPFTNCELPYDGQLEAGVFNGTDSTHIGYVFQWYIQEDPTNIIQTGYIASGLRAREYTVQIIDLSTGCDTTLSAEVPNAVSLPLVTATKIADVISCTDPNSGVGEAHVGGITDGYRFEWYTGPAIGAGPPDFTGPNVSTFPVGNFTVQAIDSATSCPSDPATISIVDLTASPVLQVTVDSEQISCDTLAPTGQLSGVVDESGIPTTAGYTFNWYLGPNDLPANLVHTGNIASGLSAAPYRLVVIEDGTNCTSFVDTLIQDMTTTPPDISLSATDVTSCAAPNGSITVTVVGNPADYTYEVYNGNGVVTDSLLLTSASNNIQNLDIGNYTVVAIDLVTQCATNPASTTINDATVPPDATIISQDQTSCDPNNLTGRLTANMGFGAISDYTYEWFEDDFFGASIIPSSIDGEIISNLDSGNYALRITNNTTQCTNDFYPSVNVAISLPVASATAVPSTYCGAAANGELHGLANGVTAGYTFYWYSIALSDTLADNSADILNLQPGDYLLTVVDDATLCASAPIPVTINNTPIIPASTFVSLDQISCDPMNLTGQITATVGAGVATDYTFEWFEDNLSGAPIAPSSPNGEVISNLDSGVYALRLTNNTTLCANDFYPSVNVAISLPVASATSVPSTYCGAAANGELHGLANGVTAGYTFYWYSIALSDTLADNSADILNLQPGDYLLTVVDDATLCASAPVPVTINNTPIIPTATFVSLDQISCDPMNLTGQITATVGAGVATDYTFEWFEDNLSGAPIAPSSPNGEVISNLDSGVYALRLTDNTTLCANDFYPSVNVAISLPVASATSVPSTYCGAAANGELHGLANGVTAGYTFYWYSIALSDTLADNSADILNLQPGDYLLTVVDDATSCASAPVPVRINNTPIIPTATFVSLDQISCDPMNLTGQITATVGAGVATDYTFEWFEDNLSGAPIAPSSPDGEVISNLDSGNYALRLTNNTTLCANDFYPSVNVAISLPVASATSVPSTYCGAAANGELHGLANGVTAGYTFYWYSIALSDTLADNSADILNLQPGDYLLTVVDDATLCASAPVPVTINDTPILPTATFVSQDQISCDPTNLTGELTATAGAGVATDYTFEWFEDNLSGAPIAASSPNGDIISSLDSGDYALRLTNNTSLCSNVFFPVVNMVITPPVETVSANPSTYCGPAANGELHGLGDGLTAGFTFFWYSVGLADTLVDNSADILNVVPGDYLLTVVNDTTACASNPAPVTVDDNTVTPNPVLTVLDNSSCDISNPNGEISITSISNENPVLYPFPNSYDFKWHDGNSSGLQLVVPDVNFPMDPDSSQIAGLGARTVALVITNSITTCSNEVLSVINNINIKPLIDAVNVTPATSCVEPFMSSALVPSVNGGLPVPSGYTFEWTYLDAALVLPIANDTIADDAIDAYSLPPGNYQVVAYNEYNCPSDPVTFEIIDNSIPPTFILAANNNISCNPGLPVGSLVASRPGGSTYSISQYEWYINSPTPANEVAAPTNYPDSTLQNLGAGNYVVRITDAATGCTSMEFATILDLPDNNPLLDTTFINDLTSCTTPDGEFGLEVSPLEQLPPFNVINRTYSFYTENSSTLLDTTAAGVLKAVTVPGGPAPADSEVSFSNLDFGDWTSIVVDNYTHCVSDPLTISINQAPSVTINVTESVQPAGCNAAVGNGELRFEASSPLNNRVGGGSGYTFTSFEHWSTDFTTLLDADPGAVIIDDGYSQKRNGLFYGYYIVSVNDIQSGCTASDTAFLPIVSAPPITNVTGVDAAECKPGDGEIIVDATPVLGSGPANDYEILLYSGNAIDLGNELVPATILSGYSPVTTTYSQTGDVVINLPPGTYTIATRERLTADKCFSEPKQVQLGLIDTTPVIDTTNVADMTCNAVGTGELNATADGGIANFNFQWYSGTDTLGVPVLPAGASVIGLLSGSYTIKVEDLSGAGRGCRYKKTFSLPKVLKDRIILSDVFPNSNCAPFNGYAEIIDIEENGNSVGPLPDYQNFRIYDNTFSQIDINNTAVPWTTLAPGNYFINAEHIATGCLTQNHSITINDTSQDPVISVNLNNPDYGCNPGAATGELEAFATAASQNVADYQFTWYQGDNTGPVVSNPAPNPFVASNLSANNSTQLYTIEIRDINGLDGNLGCISSMEYTLVYKPTDVFLLSPQITRNPQTICGPNGSLTVDEIFEDSGGGPISTSPDYTGIYSAQLLDENLNPIANPYAVFDPVTGTFGSNDIPAGTYYVQASNVVLGCAFGPVTQVIIDDESNKPTINIVQESPDYACIGGTHTGILAPTIFGGTDGDPDFNNFTVDWYLKGTLVNPLTDNGLGTFADKAIMLAPGDYTVVVTDNDSFDEFCKATRDYTVTSDRKEIVITASAADQTKCFADGTVQIETITEDLGAIGLPDPGWNVFLLDNNQNNIPAAVTGFPGDPFVDLAANTYYIQTQNNFSQCYSAPFQVTVNDVSLDPIVNVLQESPDYACIGGTHTGILAPTIFGGTDGDPNFNNFTVDWYLKGTLANPLTDNGGGAFADKAIALAAGDYTIEVTDNLNEDETCITTLDFTVAAARHDIVITASATDQTKCFADGTAQIETITEDLGAIGLPDPGWNVFLLDNNQNNIPAAVTGFPGDPFVDLAANTYYIQTQNNFSQCYSAPFQVTVNDVSVDPIVNVLQESPDYACIGGTHTGILAPTIFGGTDGDPNFNNFTVDWYLKGTLANPLTDNGGGAFADKAIALAAGDYTIEVTDNLNEDETCITTLDFTVAAARHDIVITASAADQTKCFADGTVQIETITEDLGAIGLPDPGWNVFLLDNNQNNIPAAVTGFPGDPFVDLAANTYYIQTQNNFSQCYSAPFQVTVNDVSVDPIVNVLQESPDYACIGGTHTGILAPTIFGGTDGDPNFNNFTVDWYLKGTLANPLTDNGGGAFADKAIALAAGDYTIEVTDNLNEDETCITTLDFTVAAARHDIVITASATDQTKCFADGTVQIETITEDLGAIGLPDPGWNVFLLDNNQNNIPAAVTGFPGDPFVDLAANTYYIQTQNNFSQCYSAPFQVTVNDVSVDPIVNVLQESPDYACIGGTHTGILAPTIFGGTDGDPNFNNFTVDWYLKGTLANPLTDNGGGAFADKAIALAAGDYTIEVTDNLNEDETCITTLDFTVAAARHDIDVIASGTPQTICIPDGSIQIDNIDEDGAGIVNPHLTWTAYLLDDSRSSIVPAPAESGFASIADAFSDLLAATYYVQVQDNLTQCYSDPYQVSLDDNSTNPVIAVNTILPQYSLNPNPLSWTGAIETLVNETDMSVDPYNLSWHYGLGTSNPVSGESTLNIDSLDQGMYTIFARNTITGCESEYYVHVPYQYLEPIFNTITGAKTICSPIDGEIIVTDIALDGSPDQLSDYMFDFYHDNYSQGDTPDNVMPGNDPQTVYGNINSGSYYIVALENWWWIESYPVKVEVIDSTTNPIVTFDATNYQALTSCDPNIAANGALAIEVYEDLSNPYLVLPPTYSYAWYVGDEVNAGNIITNSDTSSISGLPSGEFTVLVTNLENLCEGVETYTIEDKSITPVAIPTMTPVTNCPVEMANGIVTAQVINSNEGFDYLWYQGSDAKATPDFVGNTWYNKTLGYYTVVAIDQQFGTCISEPIAIEVEDATVNPNIMVSEIHPITNCDPAKPNAVVSASADGGVSGYTFDWYEDNVIYYTGPVASNLGSAIYEVVVTNNVTQCQSSKDVIPSVLFDIIPPPDVMILSELTSCTSPDGQATATIEGNIKDYIFKYYRKHDNLSVDNLFVDNIIYDLDTSTYLVTAENRVTGCISDPTEFAISNEQYYPIIDVIADPSDCQEPNGTANVIISDMTRDFKVTWIGDNGFEAQEKELVYIPVGKYQVVVEGTDGCVTSAEAEVKGDVIIYNGVSANYDGLNDFFAIVCLEYFPDNNVKIFNRAGLLVYEQNFYDMTDSGKRFEGFSNKGASIIGTELPIGTYFYVVDKNDGSKAKVGYLELNR